MKEVERLRIQSSNLGIALRRCGAARVGRLTRLEKAYRYIEKAQNNLRAHPGYIEYGRKNRVMCAEKDCFWENHDKIQCDAFGNRTSATNHQFRASMISHRRALV
jgi:hypothetical protein